VTMPSTVIDGSSYYSNASGTSFSAPMVSGAIALMADHFPNQSPAQWTDRLLASADNDIGYAHVNKVTFGNGVEHGYSAEAGHGILDIYAALQPILSDSFTASVSGGNSKVGGKGSYAFNQTAISSAISFGDSITNAFDGEFTYMYDALDGGFAFDMSQTVKPSLIVGKTSMSMDYELGMTTPSKNKKLEFLNSFSGTTDREGFLSFTESQSNLSLANFTSDGVWNALNDATYMFPFLPSVQGGTGLNYGENLGEGYLSFSYNLESSDASIGSAKDAYTFSYMINPNEYFNINYIGGLVNEGENFLGVKGTGAFDFSNSNNKTAFFGLKSDIKLTESYFLNVGFGISETAVNKSNSGIIQSMSGLTADSFEIGFTTFDTFSSDMLSFSISQPSRVSRGSADLRIAGLANSDGSIPYTYKHVSLEPSGRQLDLALSYNYDLNDFSSLRLKLMHTEEKGHNSSAVNEKSIYLGYSKANKSDTHKLSIGAFANSAYEGELKLNYRLNW